MASPPPPPPPSASWRDCVVCKGPLQEPVSHHCGAHFCLRCVPAPEPRCPSCSAPLPRPELRVNRVLEMALAIAGAAAGNAAGNASGIAAGNAAIAAAGTALASTAAPAAIEGAAPPPPPPPLPADPSAEEALEDAVDAREGAARGGAALAALLQQRFLGDEALAPFVAALRASRAVVAGGIVTGALTGAADEASDVDIWVRQGAAADAVLAFFRARPTQFAEKVLRLSRPAAAARAPAARGKKAPAPAAPADSNAAPAVVAELALLRSERAFLLPLPPTAEGADEGARMLAFHEATVNNTSARAQRNMLHEAIALGDSAGPARAFEHTRNSAAPDEADALAEEYFGTAPARGRLGQWVVGLHSFTTTPAQLLPQEVPPAAGAAEAGPGAGASAAADLGAGGGLLSDPQVLVEFRPMAYKVLKQVHPILGTASECMLLLAAVLDSCLLLPLCAELARMHCAAIAPGSAGGGGGGGSDEARGGLFSLESIVAALKPVLPGELRKHAESEARKAVSRFAGREPLAPGRDAALDPAEVFDDGLEDAGRAASKAGLQFDVALVALLLDRALRRVAPPGRRLAVDGPAAVAVAAVAEYLTAEIWELSGNTARDKRKAIIVNRHMELAIANDTELLHWWRLPGGGLEKVADEAPRERGCSTCDLDAGGEMQREALARVARRAAAAAAGTMAPTRTLQVLVLRPGLAPRDAVRHFDLSCVQVFAAASAAMPALTAAPSVALPPADAGARTGTIVSATSDAGAGAHSDALRLLILGPGLSAVNRREADWGREALDELLALPAECAGDWRRTALRGVKYAARGFSVDFNGWLAAYRHWRADNRRGGAVAVAGADGAPALPGVAIMGHIAAARRAFIASDIARCDNLAAVLDASVASLAVDAPRGARSLAAALHLSVKCAPAHAENLARRATAEVREGERSLPPAALALALELALAAGCAPAALVLLQGGAIASAVPTAGGGSVAPLFAAAHLRGATGTALVAALLAAGGADASKPEPSMRGRTPLFAAAAVSNAASVRLLLAAGAVINDTSSVELDDEEEADEGGAGGGESARALVNSGEALLAAAIGPPCVFNTSGRFSLRPALLPLLEAAPAPGGGGGAETERALALSGRHVEPAVADATLSGGRRVRGFAARGGSIADREETVAVLLAAGARPCLSRRASAFSTPALAASQRWLGGGKRGAPGACWTSLHRAAVRGMATTCVALIDAVQNAAERKAYARAHTPDGDGNALKLLMRAGVLSLPFVPRKTVPTNEGDRQAVEALVERYKSMYAKRKPRPSGGSGGSGGAEDAEDAEDEED